MKITPESRRECPNPRTPYCHYYYNLKEDRQLEMRDMETTVKVSTSTTFHARSVSLSRLALSFARFLLPFPSFFRAFLPCISVR